MRAFSRLGSISSPLLDADWHDHATAAGAGIIASTDKTTPGPSWSDIANWYDDLVEAGSGPHETAVECLMRLVPPLDGSEVLDLACGQGLATRALASAGTARVVGVDASAAMIELARHRENPGGVPMSYVIDDAQRLSRVDDATFDGVTCQLALMDIPDLDATLAAVRRVLKPGGWFAFVIGHPCYLVPDAARVTDPDGRPAMRVAGYFEERFWRSSNPQGVRRAGNCHRMLSTYLNALIGAGFILEATDEPRPNSRLAEHHPQYAEVPIFFAARAHVALIA